MSRTRYVLVSTGKGILAGIVWQVGLIAGSLAAPLLGFEAPPVPPDIDPNLILPLGILAGIPLAITLGELSKRLQQPFVPRVFTLFIFNYLVSGLGQVLEQVMFTTTTNLGFGSASSLIQAALFSLAVGALWRPAQEKRSLLQVLPRYIRARRPADWLWRLIVAWLIYLPIYRGMGQAGTMVDMQYLRGALYLLAVLPLIVLWRGSSRSLWLWTGAAILIQVAALPILLAYWYPPVFRLAHALELAEEM